MLIWKTNTSSAKVASYRYRCLLPVRHMAQFGYPSIIYGQSEKVHCSMRANAIVFMKSFTNEDLRTCKIAFEKKIPIILDLCDNIFIDNYAEGKTLDYIPRENFRKMAHYAAVIVTTGPALKDAIESFIGTYKPIHIIPDGCETQHDVQYALGFGPWSRCLSAFRYSPRGGANLLSARIYGVAKKLMFHGPKINLRSPKKNRLQPIYRTKVFVRDYLKTILSYSRKVHSTLRAMSPHSSCHSSLPIPIAASPGSMNIKAPATETLDDSSGTSSLCTKIVLWFGNSGATYGQAGMANVLEVSTDLYRVHQSIPIKLRIVSNNLSKYQNLIQPLSVPSEYLDWDPIRIYEDIISSDVVIIPNSKSPFSICKSANRAILALSLGVPVVATETPALQPFKDCVLFDKWHTALTEYLTRPELVEKHVQHAQSLLGSNYSGTAIAKQWIDLIDGLQ